MSTKIICPEEAFTVIQDTREKQPWIFKPDEYCIGTNVQKLDTGDYSLLGFEKEIVVERKLSTSEVANNIYEKRFEAELKRLEEFPYPYMIFEFNYQDLLMFPVNSGIPARLFNHVKVKADHLEKAIMRYMLKYKVKIIFAGKFGDKACYKLFKYFMRMKAGKL